MNFLISVFSDSDALADANEMAAIDAFNDALRANGHWVFAGGLESPDTAVVIDNRSGTPVVAHGPVVETAEHVAGFWIVNAPDVATAMRLATEGSRSCNRKVEVRKFHGD